MIGTALALGIAGISAAGSVASGLMANKGAGAQADAVERASRESVAEQRRQFDLNRADLAPWRDQGTRAINTLGDQLGTSGNTGAEGYGSLMRDFTLSDFSKDPNYDFALSEGAKALDRSAASRGQLFSGGTLKALTRYNQDFASNQIDKARANFNNNRTMRYNFLAGLSQGGQQAATNTAQLGQQAANNISQITMSAGEQIGNARASGYAGWGTAINNASRYGMDYLSTLKNKSN